jgi:hypothetical protein
MSVKNASWRNGSNTKEGKNPALWLYIRLDMKGLSKDFHLHPLPLFAGSRRKEGEMSTKPRKYLIRLKTNKGKMVNTPRVKRPKYSLKTLSSLKTQMANQ